MVSSEGAVTSEVFVLVTLPFVRARSGGAWPFGLYCGLISAQKPTNSTTGRCSSTDSDCVTSICFWTDMLACRCGLFCGYLIMSRRSVGLFLLSLPSQSPGICSQEMQKKAAEAGCNRFRRELPAGARVDTPVPNRLSAHNHFIESNRQIVT